VSDPATIIGVVISALSLLHDVSKNSNSSVKISTLKSAMSDIGRLYELLDEAKLIHDKFQEFETIAVEPFLQSVKHDHSNLSRMGEHTDVFFSAYQRLIPAFSLSTNAALSDLSKSYSDKIPAVISKSIKDIFRSYEALARELMSFQNILDELKVLHSRLNYGRDFADSLPKVKDSARWVLVYADKLIVAIIPVIGFVHYKTTEFVGSIS